VREIEKYSFDVIEPGGSRVKKLSLFDQGGVDMGILTW
jgi:hypothetical protein